MEFVLDFQGFKDKNNEFIVKELSLISMDGHVYELQLFQPPCDFIQLTENVKKQVVWLEKHFHGLYWGSGFKHYSELKDVFKNVNIQGTVFVKGSEKQKFVVALLSEFKVNVVDIGNLGCPSLQVLQKQSMPKQCLFNHNSKNCAYRNVYAMMEWLKKEKYTTERLEKVNLAIKECFANGYRKISSDSVKHLPRDFILNYHEDVDLIFDKLPQNLQNDEEVSGCKRCNKHFQFCKSADSDCWDGKNPKRKNCYFCQSESLSKQLS